MKKQAKPGHVERTRKEIKAVQRRWKMVADEVSRVERSRRCGEALPRRAYRIANVVYVAARNAVNASFAAMSRATCFCGPVPVPMALPLTASESEYQNMYVTLRRSSLLHTTVQTGAWGGPSQLSDQTRAGSKSLDWRSGGCQSYKQLLNTDHNTYNY